MGRNLNLQALCMEVQWVTTKKQMKLQICALSVQTAPVLFHTTFCYIPLCGAALDLLALGVSNWAECLAVAVWAHWHEFIYVLSLQSNGAIVRAMALLLTILLWEKLLEIVLPPTVWMHAMPWHQAGGPEVDSSHKIVPSPRTVWVAETKPGSWMSRLRS